VFLRNAWYVAAAQSALAHGPLGTKILGDNIALFLTQSGEPVALEDACPHRRLPLSMGRVVRDEIECGYHGLVFDRVGRCTRIPGAKAIPPTARVRSYPVALRYGLVWIWMGDAHRARSDEIFAIEHSDEPGWSRNEGGSMVVDCHYLYITDNLLDPSHVAWVHRGSFGNEGYEDATVETRETAQGVIAARWLRDIATAPFYARLVNFTGRCDRLQHYEVRYPSNAFVRAVIAPGGSGGTGRPLSDHALIMDSYNFITPLDTQRSHYHWFQMRNFRSEDASLSRTMDDSVRAAFEEDRIILNAVQRGFAERTSGNIDLAIDRAPLLFRRGIGRRISAEQNARAEDPI
jgi:phenylpropionate dioxygenase-like ring-hydroxylating dioxygenase large terminal subunit